MPLYKQGHKTIYQIHIPRTGGRYVRDLLKRNKFNVTGWDFTEKHVEAGVEIPHLHYDLFRRLTLPEDTHYFSVLRNPIERFKACCSHTSYFNNFWETKYWKNPNVFLNEMTSYESFVKTIEYRNELLQINAFSPQKIFLHPKTHLWKFEHGFEKAFCEWFSKSFDCNIVVKDILQMYAPPFVSSKKMEDSFDNKIQIELGDKIVDYIREYYKDDFLIRDSIDNR